MLQKRPPANATKHRRLERQKGVQDVPGDFGAQKGSRKNGDETRAGSIVARGNAEGKALGYFDDFKQRVADKTTDELKAHLSDLLGLTANNLLELAIIVAELERRGEDLKSLKIGLLPLLRQIAAGTLMPEVVVMFAGEPRLISKLSKMPTSEQRKIVSGERQLPVFSDTDQHKIYGAIEEQEEDEEPKRRNHVADRMPADRMPSGALNPVEAREEMDKVFSFAANALPRDLAEKLARVVVKNHDPQAVLDRLSDEVKKLL